MKIRNWTAAGVLGLMTLALAAQAPNAGVVAASLAETMKSIQNELSLVGKLNFVIHTRDKEGGNATVEYSTEVSNVATDPASCTVQYHRKRWMGGEVASDEDVSFSLREVLGLSVMTVEQHEKAIFEKEKTSPEDRQALHMQFDPPMLMVVARKAGDKEEGFAFTDEQMARRAAKAIGRGVELCGGKNVPY